MIRQLHCIHGANQDFVQGGGGQPVLGSGHHFANITAKSLSIRFPTLGRAIYFYHFILLFMRRRPVLSIPFIGSVPDCIS